MGGRFQRRATVILSLASLALALSAPVQALAQAQNAPAGDAAATAASPVIVNPAWERSPPVQYPDRALARGGVEGRVTAQCRVETTGGLTGCEILSETPEGLGFGEAVLDQASKSIVRPRTVDGVPEAGIMRWTVRFGNPMAGVD